MKRRVQFQCLKKKEKRNDDKNNFLTLELESVEEVEGHEDDHFVPIGVDIHSERVDIKLVDGVGRDSHNGQVFEQTLEALIVGLLHQLEDDAVGQDAIALLALGVLDVGPVLRGIGQVR